MKEELTELTICLGSSCFARGNKRVLSLIREYLQRYELEDKVDFRGNHCFGKCNRGPVLQIGGRIIEGISVENLPAILDREFTKLKKQAI